IPPIRVLAPDRSRTAPARLGTGPVMIIGALAAGEIRASADRLHDVLCHFPAAIVIFKPVAVDGGAQVGFAVSAARLADVSVAREIAHEMDERRSAACLVDHLNLSKFTGARRLDLWPGAGETTQKFRRCILSLDFQAERSRVLLRAGSVVAELVAEKRL